MDDDFSLEDLKTIQPFVPSCIVTKFGNESELVGTIGILHNAVQPYIKGIAKDKLINA